MDQINWAGIIVAGIGVVAAWLSGRSAAKAAKYNADASMASAKAEAETQAYERARKMDVETIKRQDDEIDEIRQNNQELRNKVRQLLADNRSLHEENDSLRQRVSSLERQLGEHSEQ